MTVSALSRIVRETTFWADPIPDTDSIRFWADWSPDGYRHGVVNEYASRRALSMVRDLDGFLLEINQRLVDKIITFYLETGMDWE